jgi:hypothetical protein
MKNEKNPVVEARRNVASRYTRNAPVTTGVQEKCTVRTGEMRQSLVHTRDKCRSLAQEKCTTGTGDIRLPV